MSAAVVLGALIAFFVAYRVYAKWLGLRVFGDSAVLVTPAHRYRDGHDFVPTKRGVLWGHHYTSIAGAAPILGPCVAAYWGWLPALLWIVLGAVFLGAAHDFGALVLSVREQGRSIGDVAAQVLGARARVLFLVFVLVLVWLVLAVFAMAIATLFVSEPSSVLPVNASIAFALVVGWLVAKRKANPLPLSLIALVALYALVGLGSVWPLRLSGLGIPVAAESRAWVIVLLAYAGVASALPVWLLLQPRDYLNSHQLLLGLGLLVVGILIAHPPLDAPAIRGLTSDPSAPPLAPMLFVTIACGAISGFHGLVASGTTSKQLDLLSDARAIGYGSMLGEAALAVCALLTAVAGIGLVGPCELPVQGAVDDLSWQSYYDSWSHGSANKAAAFVLGGAAFLQQVGLPEALARTVMAVLVISFAATSLDTAARVQRLVVGELGSALRLPLLRRRDLGTLVAVLPAGLLALAEAPTRSGDAPRQIGWLLWPLFGASNQLLAALTLVVLALYFARRGRPHPALSLPAAALVAITLSALVLRAIGFAAKGLSGLAVACGGLIALTLWMLHEAWSHRHSCA